MRTAPPESPEPQSTRRAPWLLEMWRSQLGKKYAMAISGIVIFGYVFLHMLGNLKLYEGARHMNEYAEWLRVMAAPAVPNYGALWAVRVVLLIAFLVHIVAAYQLARLAKRARPIGYRRTKYTAADYAGRTMRWGGVIVGLFVVYHLLHLTTGHAHPDFVHGNVYENVVIGFQQWHASAIYIAANLLLGLHIYHGMWSIFQTFGWTNRRFNHWRRYFATAFAGVIVVGNISFPVAVLTGIVR